MDLGLANKNVLITGASGGIGRACAFQFADEGARLVLTDIGEAALNEVRDALPPGSKATTVPGDLTRPEHISRIVETAKNGTHGIDVLINSAGVFHATPVDAVSVEEWRFVQDVNLTGTFLMCQAVLAAMAPRRTGRIVNIASVAGQTGGGVAGASYVASKAGVIALTKHLARYSSGFDVNVNCVSPGFIDTPMTAGWGEGVERKVMQNIPLGRAATAEEVARTVTFLASDAAGYIQGANVAINGGAYM